MCVGQQQQQRDATYNVAGTNVDWQLQPKMESASHASIVTA
jgi:hypothetical protein